MILTRFAPTKDESETDNLWRLLKRLEVEQEQLREHTKNGHEHTHTWKGDKKEWISTKPSTS